MALSEGEGEAKVCYSSGGVFRKIEIYIVCAKFAIFLTSFVYNSRLPSVHGKRNCNILLVFNVFYNRKLKISKVQVSKTCGM